MKIFTLRRACAAAALAAVAATAQAQTAAAPAGSAPNTVGVTKQTAIEANQKAVPRSDTGTLVRTGRTAGDRARDAAGSASAAMGNRSGDTGMAASDTTATTPMRGSGAMRTARSDRN